MNIAIMQPYFLPYIGYFQLMNAVDKFVVYDNIQYTKKGWINRNRFLNNGQAQYFSIPLKKDSDYLNVNQRQLAANYVEQNEKQLRKIESAYSKAPYFNDVFPLIQKCFLNKDTNLFNFIFHSICQIKKYLEIETKILVSSDFEDNSSLKGAMRVKNICKLLSGTQYINPIGGTELYTKENFKENGLKLNFLKTNKFQYKQYKNDFEPFLSILDVLMFNNKYDVFQMLNNYELV